MIYNPPRKKITAKAGLYLRSQLTSSAFFSLIYKSNYQPNFMKFCKKIIFQQSPNIPENFVKLYSVFQKLDHLTCSKLTL